MLRASVVLAALALAPPAASLAEVITLTSDIGVEPAAEERPDPVVRGRVLGQAAGVYAGFTAASVPAPDRAGDVDLRLGIRPRIWNGTLDLGYTRRLEAPCCGELALSLDQHLGDSGALGARVYFDPATDSGGAEARAGVTVVRGTRVNAGIKAQDAFDEPQIGLDIGVGRELADLCTLDLRYRDAILAPARAEMNLQMDF